MLADSIVPFLATAVMLTVTPGLDTAMVIQSAATYGARQGQCTAVGIAIGCLCWGAAAAFGLSAMLARWPPAFDLLRAVGALYLGWLGVGLLRNPRQTFDTYVAAPARSARAGDALRTGFLTNILNPKVGLFYLTLLPQFVPRAGNQLHALALASVHVLTAIVWFVSLRALTSAIGPWLRRSDVITRLDRITGAIFLILAVQLGLAWRVQF